MAGRGADAPPPLNGGEFLLQLLRNPPQHPHQPPSQTLPHDPAVAAEGPSIPFPLLYQSKGHDHLPYRPPWPHSAAPPFSPQNFFLQNPNPNWSSLSPPRPEINQTHQHHLQLSHNLFGDDDARKLVFLGTNPKSNSAHHQVHNNLMFGSLPFDIRNNAGVSNSNGNHLATGAKVEADDREIGLGNRLLNGLDIELKKSLEFNRNMELNRSMLAVSRPPPGFSNKPRSMGNRGDSFEQNVGKRKSKFGELNHRNVGSVNKDERERAMGRGTSGERRLIGQLDCPGPPAGSDLHSVSASDIEESLLELHGEGGDDRMRRDGGRVQSELDDLGEQIMGTVVLEDGSDEKRDKKKNQNARDRDYRSDKRGQWLLNQQMRNFRRQIECRSYINQLNTPFLAIYESLIPAEEEKAKQKQLLVLLEKHVFKEWPEARLYLYGSCANSFGFRKSDIDVCLAIEDVDVNKSEVLLKLADILQSDNLQNVQALPRARVPIVKLMDPATGISCDICVNNVLAVINTKLLRDYAHIDARLRQLAFIVKHWAKSRGVNETYQGTLSSYAYVLMCIHFLQQRTPAILPCLQGMERTYAVNVDNTECAYFDQVEKLCGFGSRNRESIAQLVWAFFNYWAYYHDYAKDVISVRTGSILSKRDKDWTRRIGNDRHLICIEDPFEISHDLGRVVDKYSIRVLREEFERAAEIMQYDHDPCVTLFKPYVPS